MEDHDITLKYYEENAEAFSEGTRLAEIGGPRELFLKELPEGARILDLGCGSGRDSRFFLERGYRVDAADGSEELCRIASEYAGIPVRQMRFQELDDVGVYDGIWACASILHVPKAELPNVLERIARALKKGGILYTSFKNGDFEGVRNGRYFTDFTEETLRKFWHGVSGLELFAIWATRDVRPGREEELWLNLLAIRV